jgi:protein SMG8
MSVVLHFILNVYTLQGYLSVWANMKYHYACALMFLFIVSHILVISHPTHIFDISYVHLFRALDVMR